MDFLKYTAEAMSQWTAWNHVANEALRQGEWPLWNPYEFIGVPLLANCQSAIFYPPRILYRLLDIHWATTVWILLRFWTMGMTTYICGRALALSIPSARFASFAWMLSGYTFSWTFWPMADVLVWAPILLMAAELLVNGHHRRGFFAMAFGATLTFLAGHPETAFICGLSTGLYFVGRLVTERVRGKKLLAAIFCAGGA